MKKLLLSVAAAAVTFVPAVGVSAATGTDISGSQSQAANLSANASSNNSSSEETYLNKTVNYEALYYVNYSASETALYKSMHDASQDRSLDASYTNDVASHFSMPAFMQSGYGLQQQY